MEGRVGPIWTDAENLASTGIRSPDSSAGSESLHRLSYPGQINLIYAKTVPFEITAVLNNSISI
jgi:hypothetical protein